LKKFGENSASYVIYRNNVPIYVQIPGNAKNAGNSERRLTETGLPTETESHPWSNNSPSGELLLVLRACLPSMASSAW